MLFRTARAQFQARPGARRGADTRQAWQVTADFTHLLARSRSPFHVCGVRSSRPCGTSCSCTHVRQVRSESVCTDINFAVRMTPPTCEIQRDDSDQYPRPTNEIRRSPRLPESRAVTRRSPERGRALPAYSICRKHRAPVRQALNNF